MANATRVDAASPATHGSDSRPLVVAVVVIAALLWAAWLYEPWRATPFYPVDFNESIAVMLSHDSFASRLSALFRTYIVEHGRLNGPAALYVTAQWTFFGWATRGWQLFAFAVMCLNVWLVFLVLRRLGANRFGAGVGAILFIPSVAIVGLWTAELHYPDPPLFPLFFGAVLLAAGYSRSRAWVVRGLGILVLSVGAALFKETVITALPFTLLIATCYHGQGQWDWPTISRRNVALLLGSVLLVAAFGIAIVMARRAAPVGDYVGHYGQGLGTLHEQLALVQSMFLPRGGIIGATLFLGAFVIGLSLRLWQRESTRSLVLSLAVAASLPALGTLAYLPWYYYRADYAAPFFIGSAALVAFTAPHQPRSRGEKALVGFWIVAMTGSLVLASRTAHHASRHMFALREVLGEVATQIVSDVQHGRATQLSFVVDTADKQALWFAPKVQQFASLVAARPIPKPLMLPCEDAATEVLTAGRQAHLFVALPGDCEGVLRAPPPARIVQRPYAFFSLRDMRSHSDTVQSYLWPPEVDAPTPRR
jgi:hypothetical protein